MSVHDYKNFELRSDEDRSPAVLAFLAELRALCERHGMTLEHEDAQGGFIVRNGHDPELTQDWLMQAAERTEK